jgi:hypothetical protein
MMSGREDPEEEEDAQGGLAPGEHATHRGHYARLGESDSYLGAQFRRLRTRRGARQAITAMGAKLARLVYRMLKFGQEYVDQALCNMKPDTGNSRSNLKQVM